MKNSILLPFILSGFLAILFTGCRPKPIDIEIEEPEQELVISSQIIPNEIMIVSVTRSFSALAQEGNSGGDLSENFINDLLVEQADVRVSFQGNEVTLLSTNQPGLYLSLNTLQIPNELYTLSVHDRETGKSITAHTEMKELVPFQAITPFIERSSLDTNIYLDFSFVDPVGSNWYAINIVKKGNASSPQLDINNYFSSGQNINTQTILLSDQTFSSSNYSDRVKVEGVNDRDSIAVAISNISQEYYEFLQAQERAEGLLSQLTQEPINRTTNVEGGYGFFNAHYPDLHLFDLEDY